jgi:hypothetical protein
MLTYLDPQKLRLETAPDGTLRAEIEDECCGLRVDVLRAMPLSHPEEQIVLRDGAGKELGILENLAAVPEPGQSLLRTALENRYFLPKITHINSILERFGSSVWDVETDRGHVSITTKAMHEAVSELGPGRYMLRDTEENRYEIPNLAELDQASRERFVGKI